MIEAARTQETALAQGLPEPTTEDRVGTIWALLIVNSLAFIGTALLPIPHAVGQLITMGALACAFALAILCNRRLLIRPNVILTMFSLLALASLASSLRLETGPGSMLRCARLFVFLATLWLLTPTWRNPVALARVHVRACLGVQALVLLGVLVAPGRALHADEGRLAGVIWPMPPPAVAQFTAVGTGVLVTLWLGGLVSGRTTARIVPGSLAILLLTHTRTALLGLIVGLLIAAASGYLANRRAGRFLGGVLTVSGLGAVLVGPLVLHWLARGQSSEQLSNLTGRAVVWARLLAQHRSLDDHFLGVGLADKSFGGLSIDSAWLAVYYEQGLIGVVLIAAIFIVLVLSVVSAPPSPERTIAVFLVTYLLVVSYTEVGFGDAGPYLLMAFLAQALVSNANATRTAEPR